MGSAPTAWCTECTAASTPRIEIRTTRAVATSRRVRLPDERGAREERHQRDRPREIGRVAGDQKVRRLGDFGSGWKKLRRLECCALRAADVSGGRTRGQEQGGHGEDRQDPQHEGHSSGETRRTQRRLPIRYTGRVYALGLAARWLHLASSVLLVGAAAMIVIAGRSDRATAQAWERRVLAGAWVCALVAIVSGLTVVGAQAALFEARPAAAFEARAIGRVLLETQAGHVWLVRAGFLAVLAAFLTLRVSVERRVDWRAARGRSGAAGRGCAGAARRRRPRRRCGAGHRAARSRSTACTCWRPASGSAGSFRLALLLESVATDAGPTRGRTRSSRRGDSRRGARAGPPAGRHGDRVALTQVGSVAALLGTRTDVCCSPSCGASPLPSGSRR